MALAFVGNAIAAELAVSGSTTVQKRILEPARDVIKAATGIDVTVRGISSGEGFIELMEGKVPASVASSSLKSLLDKNGLPDDGTYKEHKIIEDVIVPIVHKSNPVTELTWQQLADINTGKVKNWKEVGGPDQKIIVITSSSTSATRKVFQKKVMKKEPYIDGVREVQSTREEVGLVSKFKGGIGAVSLAFVEMNPGKVSVIKTEEISRPLSFITKGAPSQDIQTVIDYLRTPDAAKVFK
ncbi:substrate-binding domain-containing protein [bacterium]|nr:substrate-binding domain-containing protein [bacterium]